MERHQLRFFSLWIVISLLNSLPSYSQSPITAVLRIEGNVKNEPSLYSDIVQTLPAGTEVKIFTWNDTYFEIEVNGKRDLYLSEIYFQKTLELKEFILLEKERIKKEEQLEKEKELTRIKDEERKKRSEYGDPDIEEINDEELTKREIYGISYHYSGPSLAPEYHRSYEIEVNPYELTFVVYSEYGEVEITRQSFSLDSIQFGDITRSFNIGAIRNCIRSSNYPCTGSSELSIQWVSNNGRFHRGNRILGCPRGDSGDLCGDHQGFLDTLKKFIPNFDDHLE